MNRWLRHLLITACWPLLAGCSGASPPAPPPAASPPPGPPPASASTDPVAPAKPESSGAAQSSSAAQQPAAPPATNDPGSQSAIAASAASADSVLQKPRRERLVLLFPSRPLVVDLFVTIDGRALGEALDDSLNGLLAEADADRDGRVTWDEITRQPAFQRGVYGNMPVGADNDRRQVIQRYDWNRDKLVSRDELFRWLVREPHRAKPLVLQALRGSRDSSRTESPLLRALDTSGDGKLNADELAAAARRLVRLDQDEDEIVDPADLRSMSPTAADPTMTRGEAGSAAAVLLSDKTDWADFQRIMQNAYSLGGPLGPDAWPAGADLFQELDLNRDKLIGRSEWSTLQVVDPDLALVAEFGADGDNMTVRQVAPGLKEFRAADPGPNTLRFGLPAGRLEIALTPLPVPDYTEQARAALAMLDADKNGYLDEDEAAPQVTGAGGAFADVDVNGDGKVYVEELATALRKRQSLTLHQVQLQVGYRDDAWWQVADTDADGRLDSQEIDALATRFLQFDRDQNGELDQDEIPLGFVVGLSRGSQSGAPAMLNMPVQPPTGNQEWPAWFVQMDSNGDGRISRREFLGTVELFAKLDLNGDDRLDWNELRDIGDGAGGAPPTAKPATP